MSFQGRDELDAGRVSARPRRRFPGGVLLLALAGAAAPPPCAAQSISNVSGLSFGSFVAGSGGNVTVTPGGARTQIGGVVLVGQGSTWSAAVLRVSGTANASYTITLPANDTVVLSDGVHTMPVNQFTSNPPTGTLSGGGSQLIYIGATLAVGSAQPAGSYAGTFSVTVNY